MPSDIFELIGKRAQSSVRMVSHYLKEFSSFGDGWPTSLLGPGSEAIYKRQLEQSKKLISCEASMKAFSKEPSDKTFIMEFDCILTSNKRDRDRDILEPSGARFDLAMPLLWQHNWCFPIGKMIKILTQDDSKVEVRFGIADTELGRDAARLVEAGCLRLSHGFNAIKWEIMEEDEKTGQWPGVHVLEFEILEGSLVSIPSNTDAIVTAHERKSFESLLVKSWAEKANSGRTKSYSVTGGKMTDNSAAPVVNVTIDASSLIKELKGIKADDAVETEGTVSQHASLGRVQLLLEQLAGMDDLPEEAAKVATQALDELSAVLEMDEEEEEDEEETEEEVVEEESEMDDEEETEDEEDGKSLEQIIWEKAVARAEKRAK